MSRPLPLGPRLLLCARARAQFEQEHKTPHGMSIDMLVHVDGKQVALEVDGPFHFTSNKWVDAWALAGRGGNMAEQAAWRQC